MKSQVAACALVGLVGVASSAVFAQPYAAVRPQYYSYELNPDPATTSYVYDDRFTSAIRVQLSNGDTAEDAANAAVALITARIAEGTLNLDKICITLQNFGGKGPDAYRDDWYSYLRDEDAISLTVSDPSEFGELDGDSTASWELVQPWMNQAIGHYNANNQTWLGGDATQWMTNFCELLKDDLDVLGVIPERFHCEVETNLPQGSSGRAPITVMLAWEADARWDTEPVPGFGGLTMQQIWSQAQIDYGWGDGTATLASLVEETVRASHPDNSAIWMWWVGVCRRALDAANQIACYQAIKETWPIDTPKTSNYDHARADMAADTFAWRTVRNPSNNSVVLSDQWFRGRMDKGGFGVLPSTVGTSTSRPPLMFYLGEDVTSADFSAPELYYFDFSYGTPNSGHIQKRFYEPPVSGVHVDETWQQASQRFQRHSLDAITNSVGVTNEEVVPWVDIPGARQIDPSGALQTIEQTRPTLALLRSKDIREALMFGNKPDAGARGNAQMWADFKRADDQVYTPSYRDYQVIIGTDDTAPNPGHPLPLMNTLRTASPTVVEIASNGSTPEMTQLVVWFDDLAPESLGHNGRLVLECDVVFNDPEDQELNEVIGFVEIWNETEQQWEAFEPVRDFGVLARGAYGFYTPDLSTRREWDLSEIIGWTSTSFPMCDYLSDTYACEGMMGFRFSHFTAGTSTSGYVSRYDLVQFYHMDEPAYPSLTASGSMTTQAQGGESNQSSGAAGFIAPSPADFNFDGIQDATDATLFTTAWTNGERRADYNADGEVDALDLTQFLGALGRATSSGGLSEE